VTRVKAYTSDGFLARAKAQARARRAKEKIVPEDNFGKLSKYIDKFWSLPTFTDIQIQPQMIEWGHHCHLSGLSLAPGLPPPSLPPGLPLPSLPPGLPLPSLPPGLPLPSLPQDSHSPASPQDSHSPASPQDSLTCQTSAPLSHSTGDTGDTPKSQTQSR
jgi:hypothetical protein